MILLNVGFKNIFSSDCHNCLIQAPSGNRHFKILWLRNELLQIFPLPWPYCFVQQVKHPFKIDLALVELFYSIQLQSCHSHTQPQGRVSCLFCRQSSCDISSNIHSIQGEDPRFHPYLLYLRYSQVPILHFGTCSERREVNGEVWPMLWAGEDRFMFLTPLTIPVLGKWCWGWAVEMCKIPCTFSVVHSRMSFQVFSKYKAF